MERTGSVSMQDVAKEAGVSPQTVSRVANGSDAVRPQTRRKVQEAMERLGYRPNYAARALKHGRFNDVGVVLSHMTAYGNSRILAGIVDAAAENGYATTIHTLDTVSEPTLASVVDRMKQLPVDGIIIVMESPLPDFDTFRSSAGPAHRTDFRRSGEPLSHHRFGPVWLLHDGRGLSAFQRAQNGVPHCGAIVHARRAEPHAGMARFA